MDKRGLVKFFKLWYLITVFVGISCKLMKVGDVFKGCCRN